jgi:hypothetical protein
MLNMIVATTVVLVGVFAPTKELSVPDEFRSYGMITPVSLMFLMLDGS